MNETEFDQLLGERSGTERKVYDALRGSGKLTDRQLRDRLRSPGSGPRDALAKLLPLGLVRHAGKATTKGHPMQYEVTPLREIEEAQRRYAVRKPAKSPKRSHPSPGARLAELKQMEHGDARKWYPNRDKILAALPLLTHTVRMSFWESVPPDELELALEEIEELHDAAAEALEAGRERLAHEKHKAKIEKLERTKGRTEHEKDTAARKATKLRGKLISS
jgi:hypothetical protein